MDDGARAKKDDDDVTGGDGDGSTSIALAGAPQAAPVPAWQAADNPLDQALAAVSEAVQPVVDQLVLLEVWLTRHIDALDARQFNGGLRRGLDRLSRVDLVAVASSRTLFWVLCALTALLLTLSVMRTSGWRGSSTAAGRAMLQGYGVEHDAWSGGAEWERNAEDAAAAEGSGSSGVRSYASNSNLKLSTAVMHVTHDCDFTAASPLFVVSSLDGLIEGGLGLGATFAFSETGKLEFGPSAGSRFGALTDGADAARGNMRASKGRGKGDKKGSGASGGPLFVIYGEPSQWSRAVSPDVRQMFRALLNAYGWRTFLPRRIGRARVSYSSWEALNVDLEVAFGRRPDVLLFIGSVASWLPALGRRYVRKGILNSRVWVFAEDVHWHSTDERKALLSLYSRADVLVSPYAYLLHDLFPEIAQTVPVKWVPHAAGVGHMLPANALAVPRVLVTGPLKGSRWQRHAEVVKALLSEGDSPLLHVSAVRQIAAEAEEDEGEEDEEAADGADEGAADEAGSEEEADGNANNGGISNKSKQRSGGAGTSSKKRGADAVLAAAGRLAAAGGSSSRGRSRGRALAAVAAGHSRGRAAGSGSHAGQHNEIEAAYAEEEEEEAHDRGGDEAAAGGSSNKGRGKTGGPKLLPANASLYIPSSPPGSARSGLSIAGWSHAVALGRHLACLVDGLILNYAVAKLFEIPATGCLLLINEEMEPIMEKLGFIAMRHYVPYTGATLRAVVAAVVDPANRAAVDEMRRAGQRLVWARHMTTHRAAVLHDFAVADAEAGHKELA